MHLKDNKNKTNLCAPFFFRLSGGGQQVCECGPESDISDNDWLVMLKTV